MITNLSRTPTTIIAVKYGTITLTWIDSDCLEKQLQVASTQYHFLVLLEVRIILCLKPSSTSTGRSESEDNMLNYILFMTVLVIHGIPKRQTAASAPSIRYQILEEN